MRMAQLGVVIDSSGAKKGAQETTQALDTIGASAKRSVVALGEVGAASTRAATTMTAATVKGREMAASQTTLATATQAATRGIATESAGLTALTAQMAATKASLDSLAASTVAMNTGMTVSGASAGRFAAVLAPFGGPWGAAIIGALTVIPMVLDKVRGNAEEAAKAAKRFRDEVEKMSPAALQAAIATEQAYQAQLRSNREMGTTAAGVRKRIDEIAASESRLAVLRQQAGQAQREAGLKITETLEKNQRDLLVTAERIQVFRREGQLAADAYGEAASAWQDATGRARTLGEALREQDPEAQRLLTSFRQLATAANTLKVAQDAVGKAAKDAKAALKADAKEWAAYLKEGEQTLRNIHKLLEEANGVTAKTLALEVQRRDVYDKDSKALAETARERIRSAQEILDQQAHELELIGKTKEQRKQLIDLERYRLALLKGFTPEQADAYVRQARLIDDAAEKTRNWGDALGGVASTMRDLSQVLNGTGNDAARMLGVLASSLEALAQAQARAKAMRDRNERLSGAQAFSAGVGGLAGSFGAGYAVGSTTTSKTAGALGGAAAGAATGAAAGSVIPGLGTLAGGLIGGVVGGVAGLLGAAGKGKQAAVQMEIAQGQLGKSLDALRATFANDSLGASIAAAKAQFDDLKKATEAAYSGKKNETERRRLLSEIGVLEEKRIAILTAQWETEKRLATDDLEVRRLYAAGLDAEAEALRRATENTREINAAIERYGEDSTYVEKLREVQEAEKKAAEEARARAEAEKARQQALAREQFAGDITARRQTLSGDTRGAFITRQTLGNASAIAQAQELVTAGTITAEMFEQLKTLLGDEMVQAIADFDKAVERARQQQQDDLAVRALVAQGKDAEAAALRVEIANRNELADVTDEALRQQILYVQGLEAEARARAEAEAEAEAAAQEYAAAMADIDRRQLAALRTLDPAKADELEAKQREADRAKELAGAIDDAMRARLEELYALEDQAAAAIKAAEAIQAAADAAKKLADFSSDLESQWLRATGRGFEASVRELERWREEQKKAASEVGLGQDAETLRRINETFDARYRALIQQRIDEAVAPTVVDTPRFAADRTTVLGEDTTAFRSSRSITESTALRLVDYAASQLAVQREILVAVRGGRPSVSALDRALGQRVEDTALMVQGVVL